jgi:hypothetical protein
LVIVGVGDKGDATFPLQKSTCQRRPIVRVLPENGSKAPQKIAKSLAAFISFLTIFQKLSNSNYPDQIKPFPRAKIADADPEGHLTGIQELFQ